MDSVVTGDARLLTRLLYRVTDKERELLAELCRCMRALMNTSEGFQKALEWNESIPLMVQAMPHINIVSQSLVLYVLAAVGVVSHEGHLFVALRQNGPLASHQCH
jgi:hypothetical protein